jgi:DNA-binding beta-propeller fold protein YncE
MVGNRVVRIDPRTNQISATVSLPEASQAYSLMNTPGKAWVSQFTHDGEAVLAAIDAGTNQASEPIPHPGITAFAAEGRGLWILAPKGTIYLFNVRTGKVDASLNIGQEPDKAFSPWSASIDTSTSSIWVADYRDLVTRVNLR